MLFFAFDSPWPGEYDRLLMIRAKASTSCQKIFGQRVAEKHDFRALPVVLHSWKEIGFSGCDKKKWLVASILIERSEIV